jgi:hypothetical protein
MPDLAPAEALEIEQSPVDPAQEQFTQLMQRQVGFELFLDHARGIPEKTYVAISGRYVLLGFTEQGEADEFFKTAIARTL